MPAGVNDNDHVRNCHRGLCDIRRTNHLDIVTLWQYCLEAELLLFGWQTGVQWQHPELPSRFLHLQGRHELVYLTNAGQEDEDGPLALRTTFCSFPLVLVLQPDLLVNDKIPRTVFRPINVVDQLCKQLAIYAVIFARTEHLARTSCLESLMVAAFHCDCLKVHLCHRIHEALHLNLRRLHYLAASGRREVAQECLGIQCGTHQHYA
mmetsp:Transcript_112373/g.204332  ORF Transcript_112373/g.204332 Transcript_112373/m.204332 type:complete len:207 (-) Transcript_112373:692-1312(-)